MSKAAFLALLLSSLLAVPAMALLAAPPPAQGPRLVLHAPWADGGALVLAAGGAPIGLFTAPMGLLAIAEDAAHFDARLRAAGAWGVLDGTALALICGAPPNPS